MYFTLRKNLSKTYFYFIRIFFFATVPIIPLGIAAAYFWQDQSPSIYLANDSSIKFIWQIIGIGFIVPFFETAILIFPTVLARDAINKKRLAAFIGSLPLILLHGLIHWNKPLVIAWFFYVQAFSYLELRESGASVKSSFIFIFLIHSLFNSILIVIT
jgi:hypothetical protein